MHGPSKFVQLGGRTLVESERHPKTWVGIKLALLGGEFRTKLVIEELDDLGRDGEGSQRGAHRRHLTQRREEPLRCFVRHLPTRKGQVMVDFSQK